MVQVIEFDGDGDRVELPQPARTECQHGVTVCYYDRSLTSVEIRQLYEKDKTGE